MDPKKLYYYTICGIAFFILLWGAIDLVSSGAGLLGWHGGAAGLDPAQVKNDQAFDAFYQQKMLLDRLWDSLARVIVAGLVFAYFRFTANKLDKNVS
jgi:hypothetical protein